MIYRILKMEILYIYLSKTLFYFILLPKTLMFSLSEYLSRRQPGPGKGREGREGLSISSEVGECPHQWWLSDCQWAVLSRTRRATPSGSSCSPLLLPPRRPRGTSCLAPWLLCPSLDPPASNKYYDVIFLYISLYSNS